jgi:hypothetical protein
MLLQGSQLNVQFIALHLNRRPLSQGINDLNAVNSGQFGKRAPPGCQVIDGQHRVRLPPPKRLLLALGNSGFLRQGITDGSAAFFLSVLPVSCLATHRAALSSGVQRFPGLAYSHVHHSFFQQQIDVDLLHTQNFYFTSTLRFLFNSFSHSRPATMSLTV